MRKRDYKDFIGEKIEKKFKPCDVFGQPYQSDVLRDELYRSIRKELGWTNGLLCAFKNVKTIIEGDSIVVSGVVTKCEVDC